MNTESYAPGRAGKIAGKSAERARVISRMLGVVAGALLVGTAACARRTAPPPNMPARIDPVQLPMAELPATRMPVVTIPFGDIPMPAAREGLIRLVDSLTRDTTFRMAHWGIVIVDPEVMDTLVSVNANKLFMPASNQKLVTGAVALEVLGADYRWRTPVLLRGRKSGSVFTGDVVLLGSGDPSWSDAMQNGDALRAFDPIVSALAARGISQIRGRLLVEGDRFSDAQLGHGWAWDDLDFAYSAGVDDLMFNENFFDVTVRGGSSIGAKSSAAFVRDIGYPALRNSATSRARTDTVSARANPLTALSDSTGARLEITGTVRTEDSSTLSRAFRNPNAAGLAALHTALTRAKVRVQASKTAPSPSAALDTLVVLESPPLSEVLARLEKPSQNQIAEAVFKTIGYEATGVGSADSARAVIERQLERWNISLAEAAVRDGSGLSRHDYLSPRAVARLLVVMQSHPAFATFYASLPIAGVDGTIASRMRGTPAASNLRAKTGTLDKARSLSGYVNTRDGHQLVFSMLCNNWTGSVRDVERVQDAIAVYLASVRMEDMRRALP